MEDHAKAVSSLDSLARQASEQEMESLISGNTTVVGYASIDALCRGHDGVYLSPYLKEEYGTNVELTDIQLLPDTTRLGEGKSHHDVMFSEITISQNDDTPIKIDVALKRYSTNSGQAYRELETTEKIREKGYETFEPLAVVVAGDISVLVTKKRDDIYVLDNTSWQLRPNDPEYETEVVPVLKQIAQGMASLHISGIHHGDAVAKNFAVNETNGLVMFDFEDTQIMDDPFLITESLFGNYGIESSLALKDVVHFWQFQTKPYENEKPFLIEEEPDVVVGEFITKFLNPYIESVVNAFPDTEVDNIVMFREEAISRIAKSVGADVDNFKEIYS